ncbi:hypothetical protein ACFQX6_06650 [Streptosporangium lutulentum]
MVAAVSVVWSPPAAATACAPPTPSETQPGYTVADPWCEYPSGRPFTALPGATAHAGVKQGAAYRIEVPANWNGELVLYAHGYRGTDTTVYVDNSPCVPTSSPGDTPGPPPVTRPTATTSGRASRTRTR